MAKSKVRAQRTTDYQILAAKWLAETLTKLDVAAPDDITFEVPIGNADPEVLVNFLNGELYLKARRKYDGFEMARGDGTKETLLQGEFRDVGSAAAFIAGYLQAVEDFSSTK